MSDGLSEKELQVMKKMATQLAEVMTTTMSMVYAFDRNDPDVDDPVKKLQEINRRAMAEAKFKCKQGDLSTAHMIAYIWANTLREIAKILEDAADAREVP